MSPGVRWRRVRRCAPSRLRALRSLDPSAAALSSDDLTRTLSSLADLRDRGAISGEEYERKKADLLSRL